MTDTIDMTNRIGWTPLNEQDPAIFDLINEEATRQHDKLELIASENYTSQAVMETSGSILTNKYAEGYPAKRYYGGCEFVDKAEQLAIDRAKQLFGADYANVQPLNLTGTNRHQGGLLEGKNGNQQGGKQYQCRHPEGCQQEPDNILVGECGLTGDEQQEPAENARQRGE